MKNTKILITSILLLFASLGYAEDKIEDVLPAGFYQFNTSSAHGEDNIPSISSSEVEVTYEDSVPYIKLHQDKLRIYFSIGDRLIPSISFLLEPKQENNRSTALIVYTATKRSRSDGFEGT